jgi:hypothetical protein
MPTVGWTAQTAVEGLEGLGDLERDRNDDETRLTVRWLYRFALRGLRVGAEEEVRYCGCGAETRTAVGGHDAAADRGGRVERLVAAINGSDGSSAGAPYRVD